MCADLTVSLGQYSDKGRKSSNQDFIGAHIPKNAQLHLKGVALAMADGISSSDVSHIASETSVKNFMEDYYCTSETWTVKNSVERVLCAANSWLYSQTLRGPHRYDKDKGYVCTFSTLVVKNHTAHVFHVGDTRIYRLNSDGMEQLTNDHRLWASAEKSYLSRALGIHDECDLDYRSLRVKKDDIFIICTDGIYEFVEAPDIIGIIAKHGDDLDLACQTLAEAALSHSSDDNLSVQILRIDQLPDQQVSDIQQTIATLPYPPQLSARMEFDGYSILRELHANNRSHVFLAEDIASCKKVVLKVPAVDVGCDESSLERFMMEEWVARRVNSAYVLKADLPDRQRNYIYTVFEYIEGQTLAQWAKDNPKPSMVVVRDIVEQIAKGMYAFHRLEMLHQDLRPENIMINIQGTVKIIDFGSVSVAGLREIQLQEPLTYLQGTALYSAPEYFIGRPGTVRSEIFSLGIISYFLLSGRYPYGTKVAQAKTLSAQKKLWYYSVLDEKREIPAWVDDAIHKAVHPMPEYRYDGVFEFVHDLREPCQNFINKTRPPLIERNPVALWQGVSAILAAILIYVCIQTSN